jgi:hypothetical protein
MRGLKTHQTASVVIRGHAFVQNLRRDHYEVAIDARPVFRLVAASTTRTHDLSIQPHLARTQFRMPCDPTMQQSRQCSSSKTTWSGFSAEP